MFYNIIYKTALLLNLVNCLYNKFTLVGFYSVWKELSDRSKAFDLLLALGGGGG